jgi:hypothetical protein
MSDKADVVPKLPPAHEQHAADVTWDDFVAALPATLAMHPERERTGSVARARSGSVPRRVVLGNGALRRAYMAARASARRERSTARRDIAARALMEPRHTNEELVANDSSFAAAASSSDGFRMPMHRGDATGRWLLSGLVLTGSVIVAVLTSVITVRAMNPASALAPMVSARQPTSSVPAPAVISHDTSTTVRPPDPADSVHALAIAPSAAASSSQKSSDTVAPSPLAKRPSPSSVRVAHASSRPAQHAERHSLSIAEHARTSSQSTSAIPSTRMTTSMTASPSPATSSAPAPATSTIPQSTAPAASTPANNNSAVLDELRAIHAEIDARKKHMDSLTAALDSLKHISKPD